MLEIFFLAFAPRDIVVCEYRGIYVRAWACRKGSLSSCVRVIYLSQMGRKQTRRCRNAAAAAAATTTALIHRKIGIVWAPAGMTVVVVVVVLVVVVVMV